MKEINSEAIQGMIPKRKKERNIEKIENNFFDVHFKKYHRVYMPKIIKIIQIVLKFMNFMKNSVFI